MTSVRWADGLLEFYRDPAGFLSAAGAHLAADPVVSTVVTDMAHRRLAQLRDGTAPPDRDWWMVATDGSGCVLGVAMRSAADPPYPPFLLPMPDQVALALARALYERGEQVRALNGALPAVSICAAELSRLAGGRVVTGQHTRLFELGQLVSPRAVAGELRLVSEVDAPLATAWFEAFHRDADEQAGRVPGAAAHESPDSVEILRRIRTRRLWFWVDSSREPVHLTGASTPALGVTRIGPVYTPPDQRGRGWASNAVAGVSRLLQAEGARVCLFTDQANRTSNKIYPALGYQAVVDMANLVITD